jgi:hypothetical protein
LAESYGTPKKIKAKRRQKYVSFFILNGLIEPALYRDTVTTIADLIEEIKLLLAFIY